MSVFLFLLLLVEVGGKAARQGSGFWLLHGSNVLAGWHSVSVVAALHSAALSTPS